MDRAEYQKRATDTLSRHFFHERVSVGYLEDISEEIISLGSEFDTVKRLLYYPEPKRDFMEVEGDNSDLSELSERDQILLHCAIGAVTEAIELYESIFKALVTKEEELDVPNIKQELGDGEWYPANIRDIMGWTQEEIQDLNIEKLQLRNKGKSFNAEGTANRDIESEQKLFETNE